MILDFPEKLPSWNQFFGRSHWSGRKPLNQRWRLLLLEAHPRKDLFRAPVEITVTVYSTHPMDCSNICFKPLEDAMIGKILRDDSPEYVRSVTLISSKAKTKKEERTTVEIFNGPSPD